MNRQEQYNELFARLDVLCQDEADRIAIMSTIVCEIYHCFDSFHWVGFYRHIGNETLKVGPYQGSHGCLTIPFSRGICGQCAREKGLLNIPDVTALQHHIACSSTTKPELVVPILTKDGNLLAVLDIDSNIQSAFNRVDEDNLSKIDRYFQDDLN